MSPGKRVVVVTGASAGIGRATARAFAARGDDVALVARGADGLEAARKECEAAGVRALDLPTDVADADAVEAAAERTESELGPIDVWVNVAMTAVLSRAWDMTAEEYHRVTAVTYLGSVHGALSALRRMRPRNRGTIVQVGSALSYRAIPLQSSYCGAKHAVKGFCEALRCELLAEGSGVRVTMVHLPGVNTTQFGWVRLHGVPRHPQPVPPIYQPEVAADGIVFAADHPEHRELLVGGSTVVTVVGEKVAPGLLDRYLARTNIQGQQTDIPVDEHRADDLFAPVPGDHGAHGIFDERAHPRSLQLEATKAWRGVTARLRSFRPRNPRS